MLKTETNNKDIELHRNDPAFLLEKVSALEARLIAKTHECESLAQFKSSNMMKNSSSNDLEVYSLKARVAELEQNNLLLGRENEFYRKKVGNKDDIDLKTTKVLELEESCNKLLAENSKINELCKIYIKENEELKKKRINEPAYDSFRLSIYSEITQMSKKMALLEKRSSELQADNEFLAYKIKEKDIDFKNHQEMCEKENEKIESSLKTVTIERDRFSEEIKALKEQISTVSLERHDLEIKLNNLRREVENEKTRLIETTSKSLKFDSEEKAQRSNKLKNSNKLERKAVEEEDFLKRSEMENENLKATIEALRSQVISLENLKYALPKTASEGAEASIMVQKNQHLKQKLKQARSELSEQMNLVETLKIYQEKYETLFRETKELETMSSSMNRKTMEKIVLLSTENDRLHALIRECMNYKDFSIQQNKNLNDYNDLLIAMNEMERKNSVLIEENGSLKMLNEQKSKEINRLMIENSQIRTQPMWNEKFLPIHETPRAREFRVKYPSQKFFPYH